MSLRILTMLPVLLLALLGLVSAAPTVILEKAKAPPQGWEFHHNASSTDKITITLALKDSGVTELKSKLHQRLSTNHADLGKHLSRDQVRQYLRPTQQTANTVTSWLKASGVKNFKTQGSLISFEASAKKVKELFEADLRYYSYDNDDSALFLRSLSYSIPSRLRDFIDFVHPITNFMPPRGGYKPKPKPGKPTPKPTHPKPTKWNPWNPKPTATSTKRPVGISTVSAPVPEETDVFWNYPCLVATSPRCIRQLYNITYEPSTQAKSPVRFGVAGFLEQWIHYADVAYFLSQYTPEYLMLQPPYNFTVELLNGGTNPQDDPRNAGIEASLDVQYAMGLGYPTNVVYYVTGGRGIELNTFGKPLPEAEADNEPYLEFLEGLLEKPDSELPHVLSISYADDEMGVPRPYAIKVCDLFAALAARGVSVLVASGDGGAAGTGQSKCVLNDGTNKNKMFVPTFPASCPYVTAVGAVDNVAPPVMGEEFSAGGFSNYFGRPAWQDEAVKPYLDRLVTAKDARVQLLNQTGRGVPDISAIGSGFQIILAGEMSEVLGTSASTPVVAAMVALVNDARMRAGKPSLGFLNPLLYAEKVKKVLRDVTVGESSGCQFPDGNVTGGFSAAQGWDAVTGLGTVKDFQEFLGVLL
ncbi:Tripeptidyl-peptidase sed2 [Podospora australis]|uniref:tripeptidyl-peptidase II n=1 Tax=Podospora australis TaxID=1536484 RepID=A0AAN6WMB4_9PEZI|nr:Tripeptidyl-peptidase sed2 [Podospora australis]